MPGRLTFRVRLNEPAPDRVTVDYSTFDRTATRGEDYRTRRGTLTFGKGEQLKTVDVTLLYDDHDDAEETFGLRLSNARGAYIGKPTATGTIRNSGPMPQAWLSRFGRAAADNALEAIGRRLRGAETAETHVTVAGRRVDELFAQGARAVRDGTVLDGVVPGGDGRGDPVRDGGARQGEDRDRGDGGKETPADGRSGRRADRLGDESAWARMDRMRAQMLDDPFGAPRVGERAPRGIGPAGGVMLAGDAGGAMGAGAAGRGAVPGNAAGGMSGGGMAARNGGGGRGAADRLSATWRRDDGTTDWAAVLDTVAGAAGEARWAQLYRRGTEMLRRGERLLGEAEGFDARDALMDSSFHYARPGGPDGEPAGWLGEWAVWGETAATRFKGAEQGLSVDGRVATALVGFDSRRERWLAGVALAYSEGAGAYRRERVQGGTVTSRMTSLHPYARFELNERTNLWATLGYGAGDLSLTPARAQTPVVTGLEQHDGRLRRAHPARRAQRRRGGPVRAGGAFRRAPHPHDVGHRGQPGGRHRRHGPGAGAAGGQRRAGVVHRRGAEPDAGGGAALRHRGRGDRRGARDRHGPGLRGRGAVGAAQRPGAGGARGRPSTGNGASPPR